ncbi:DUF1450 domain-containing protein [Radiobacillus sp. PE A8.2]|uniref:DUF1450 domain-containing protein n=1 Tax=Radiobacillus sp. PE A8.2 TaxID=3380349 RepID=UPI00388FCE17
MSNFFSIFSRDKKKIKFCATNLDLFYDDEALDLVEAFAEDNDIEIVEMHCLDNCEECPFSPYAVYGRKKIFAETPEQVLVEIKQLIETEDTD